MANGGIRILYIFYQPNMVASKTRHVVLFLTAASSSLQLQRCNGFCIRAGSSTLVQHASRRYLSGGDDDSKGKGPQNASDEDTADAKDEGKPEAGNSYSWAELQADPELRQMEFDQSMRRKNKILLPQRISEAVTTLGWLFVVTGIILNALGYAWVADPSGGLKVGTMDESNFQREIMKEKRRAREEAEDSTTLSMSETNKRILSWINQRQQDPKPA